MESDVITLQDLFEFKIDSIAADRTITGGSGRPASGRCSSHKFEKHGIELPANLFTMPPPTLSEIARGSGDHVATVARRRSSPRHSSAAVAATVRGCVCSAAGVQITQSPLSNFPDMAFVVSLPSDQKLSAAAGPRHRERQTGARRHRRRSPGPRTVGVVLVIDASNSMAGTADRAGDGGRARVRRAPQPGPAARGRRSSTTTSPSAPADERTRRRSTRRSRRCRRSPHGTHIYDALQQAATLLRRAESRTARSSSSRTVRTWAARSTGRPRSMPSRMRKAACSRSGCTRRSTTRSSAAIVADKTSGELQRSGDARPHSVRSTANSATRWLTSTCSGTARSPARTPTSTSAVQRRRHSRRRPDELHDARPRGGGCVAAALRLGSLRSGRTITLIVVILVVASLLGYAVFRLVYRPHQELTRRIGQFVTLPQDTRPKEAAARRYAGAR